MRLGSPVLLYHTTFRRVPPDLAAKVHNVTPERVLEHLSAMQRAVRFVSVDELAAARSSRGLAALTFDDGYKCVVETMAPALIDRGIPFTIYVNGASLESRVFWRDKVRAIMGAGLAEECERFLVGTRRLPGRSFYKYTKHPDNDSRLVEAELDQFLAARGLTVDVPRHVFDSRRWFLDHPLVTYGNHSHHHYVLSSLPREAQEEEIRRTHDLLRAIPGIQRSGLFSVPFGEPSDFDQATLEIVRDLGYRGILLSRQRLNFRRRTRMGLVVLERFMPEDAPLGPQVSRLRPVI